MTTAGRVAVAAAALLLGNVFLGWAIWVWAVLPYGSTLFLAFAFFWPLLVVAAAAGVLVSLPALLHRRSRRSAMAILVWSTCTVIGAGVGAYVVGPRHRAARVRGVVAAARPLTAALERFEQDHGRPASQLQDLIPKYLSAIPPTGMGGYPEWEYVGDPKGDWQGNTWVLVVHTGGPGINFDQLLYLPNQRYPAYGYGGRLERIHDWAYVHE